VAPVDGHASYRQLMSLTKRRTKVLMVFASIALIAAACGSASTDSEVRDFSEIQMDDFVFTVDANGVAKMTVTTDVEAACSIAWGEDDSLGFLHTDLDMSGGAHQKHEVILEGAVPGETYSFRVQGSTPDGTLFQSALSTFTLPELPEGDSSIGDGDETSGTNVAQGATVLEVSSIFSDSWAGENALDGDMTTEWATSDSGDDAFLEIDLGSPQDIIGVEFITRSMSDGTAVTTEYTVTVDGGDTFGPFPAGDPSDSMFSEAEFTGQILRFEVAASTGGNTGAIEVRAFTSP